MKALIYRARTNDVILVVKIPQKRTMDALGVIEEAMSDYTGHKLSVIKSKLGDHTASIMIGDVLFDNFKFNIKYHDSEINA